MSAQELFLVLGREALQVSDYCIEHCAISDILIVRLHGLIRQNSSSYGINKGRKGWRRVCTTMTIARTGHH